MKKPIAHFEIHTTGFIDSDEERHERINEDVGAMSLAIWLVQQLRARGYETSDPWPEDHGSDFSIGNDDKTYVVACNVPSDPDSISARWGTVLIAQDFSFLSWVMRSKHSSQEDPLCAIVAGLLESHPDIVKFERFSRCSVTDR